MITRFSHSTHRTTLLLATCVCLLPLMASTASTSSAPGGLIPMVKIEGGEFDMGSPPRSPENPHVDNDENPQRKIRVGDFMIGTTPVTQAQWKAVMGSNPSQNPGDDLPVESVSWYQAVAFCNRLSEREGLNPVYRDYGAWGPATMRLIFADETANGYRLPTEAEWEFAARGGKLGKGLRFPGASEPDSIGWHRDNGGVSSMPVRQKAPNELGLYDMAGNVLQWCWDGWNTDAYKGAKLSDPSLSHRNARVARGAAWWNRPESLRSTKRNWFPAQNAFHFVGFRVARGPNPELAPKLEPARQAQMLKTFTTQIPEKPNIPAEIPSTVTPEPPPAVPAENIPTVELKDYAGAPTLFINGQPNTGLMLWRHAEKGTAEFADFRAAGIHLIQPDIPLMWVWKSDGKIDIARVNVIMKAILDGNPDALVAPRIHMHQPDWWRVAHPERQVQGYAPAFDRWAMGDWDINTYSDLLWREQAANAAQALIRYLEEHYGKHMMGYIIGAGDTGEWSPGWVNGGEFDFNPIQRDAFRKWLKDPKAEVPRDRLRDGSRKFFLDPIKEKNQIDYVRFESEATTDTLLFFASKYRETLNELGRKRIIGVFFGYRWDMYYRMGTHDFLRVLKSPDIHAISSLSPYPWRVPGGLYFPTANAASIRLHGKLLYNEEDSATPLSKRVKTGWNGSRYGPPDNATTQQLLIHKVVAPWLEGGTNWYMDWLNEDWYRDPELMQTIAATQKLLQSQLGKDRASVAQIAVFSSEDVVQHVRPRQENMDNWRSWIREPISRIGTTADFYDVEEMDQVAKMGQYKLWVFLDSPEIDPSRIPANVQVLWTYLPGFDVKAASNTIGFPVVEAAPQGVFNPGTAPATNSGAQEFAPGIFRNGRVFWAPAPPLKTEQLRAIAEAAGVHFYGQPGEQILANKSMLMLHAASDGEKEIRLPEKTTVADAFTGEVVGKGVSSFKVPMKLGETRVWTTETSEWP